MPEVSLVAVIKNPAEAYFTCVDKGAELCSKPVFILFHSSFIAGCYIGMGGLLALVISGNIPEVTANNPGFQSLLFAFLFPVNLLLIILTGGLLFTGSSMTTVAAVIEGKSTILGSLKVLVVSWWGNFLGSLIFALFTEWCGLVDGPAGALALKLTIKKTSMSFGKMFARGIGCNWLVCLAVYLSTMAQDLSGKYIAILICISAFVAIGYEHIPANFYTLSMGYIQNRQFSEATAHPSVGDIFYKNFLPVTLGNFFAGAFCMAMNYSIAYGRLSGIWKPKAGAGHSATGNCLSGLCNKTPKADAADEDIVNVDDVKAREHAPDAPKKIDAQEIVLITTSFAREVSHEGN